MTQGNGRGSNAQPRFFSGAGAECREAWRIRAIVVGVGLMPVVLSRDWAPVAAVSMSVVSVCLAIAGQYLFRQWTRTRTRRRNYRSGELLLVEHAVADEWQAGTGPRRLRALALAGLGHFAAARRDLLSSQPCGQEDHELRLCTNIVMLTFEGNQDNALRLCRHLLSLPAKDAGASWVRRRARREGIVALARAVCGAADEEDYRALGRAASIEPSLHWAWRYGAAIACCARSEPELACSLVEGAPSWSHDSYFRSLHSRILGFQAG